MTRFIATLERITDATAVIGALFVLPLVLGMTYEVVSRYAFRAPTFWAYEIAYMLMGAIFMCGMAVALKHRQHVSVDFIYNGLGPRARALIDVIGFLAVLPCAGWMAYELFFWAQRAYLTGRQSGQSAWNPIIWPYRGVLFVGFAVLTLQIVLELLKSARVLLGRSDREQA